MSKLLAAFCINPLLFDTKRLIPQRKGDVGQLSTKKIQTVCVTNISFNADYLAIPNNLLTHTISATGVHHIIKYAGVRALALVYGFSCIRAARPLVACYQRDARREAALFFSSPAAEAVATGNAVAMIAYLGNGSDCTNGLAIALEDVSSNTLSWNNYGSNNEAKTAAEWCSAWNTSKAVTGGTWRLPSAKDWQYMFIGCGSGESYSEPSVGMTKSYSGLASKLSTAGGTALQSGRYWSSTELIPGFIAWRLVFVGSNADFNGGYKYYDFLVRACLAF